MIDAHFAQGTMHIVKYVKVTTHDVVTARDIAYSLSQLGGIPNSFVQLVRLDRVRLELIEKKLVPLTKNLSTFIGRGNDYSFEQIGDWKMPLDADQLNSSGISYKLTAQSYSGMPGATFIVNLNTNQVVLQPVANLNGDSIDDLQPGAAGIDLIDNADIEHIEEVDLDDDVILQSQMIGNSDELPVDESIDVTHDENLEDNVDDEDEVQLVLPLPIFGLSKLLGTSSISTIIGPRGTLIKKKRIFKVHIRPQNEPIRQDVVATAVRRVRDLLHGNQQEDNIVRSGVDWMKEYDDCSNLFEIPIVVNKPGWGRRDQSNTLYGATYIEHFKPDIVVI